MKKIILVLLVICVSFGNTSFFIQNIYTVNNICSGQVFQSIGYPTGICLGGTLITCNSNTVTLTSYADQACSRNPSTQTCTVLNGIYRFSVNWM